MPTAEFFREQAEIWERRADAESSPRAQQAALAAARKCHGDANFEEMMSIGLVAAPEPVVHQPVIRA